MVFFSRTADFFILRRIINENCVLCSIFQEDVLWEKGMLIILADPYTRDRLFVINQAY